MNDGGIDAESLSNTIEYLLNEPSTNRMCPIQGGPIDMDLPFQKVGNDLRIDGFDPEIRDTEGSSDEDSSATVKRRINQACGNYSNAFIEEQWKEKSSEKSSKSAAQKVELKKKYDLLRETANVISMQRIQIPISVEPLQEEPHLDNKEVPEINQRPNQKLKKKKPKFKNVAIESILGIKNTSTVCPTEHVKAPTESSPSIKVAGSLTTADVVAKDVRPAVVNGRKPQGRGSGRFTDSSRRNNISMIRPECINGYDADPDNNPNNILGNRLPARDEFPPL